MCHSAIRAGPTARDLQYATNPHLWPCWPFLPVVRRSHCLEELGLMYDARGTSGVTGFSATVFLCNLFQLPATESEFLRMPREVFDTAEELLAAGWRVD